LRRGGACRRLYALAVRLVLDWDGTVTEVDTLHLVVTRFGDPEMFHRVEQDLGRRLTLHEVIATELRTITTPLDEALAYLLDVARIRPGFREIVEEHHPLVLSSGFHELIEPLLAREGVEVEVLANHVDPQPDGWIAHFRDETACQTCGEACKRGTLPGEQVVYVGDGYSDRCAALAADRVFAIGNLARYLDEQGVPYEHFDDFVQLRRALRP
jgi:2-hydroxy-3-keto-5-methylthiopentenyl-1-phosphate phosphatase